VSGAISVSWIEGAAQPRAQIRGNLGNAIIAAEMAAP
jgi:hypothetical protein